MTSFEQDNEMAKDFLHSFFQPGKPSWSGDAIQGHVLKTENAGKIVSAIIYEQLTHNENWVFIHALGTSVEQRKRGHARALLENLMKKDGAPHMICLETINGDSDLPPMYRSLGFIPSSTYDEQIKRDIKSLGKGANKTLVLNNKAFTERKKLLNRFCDQLGCDSDVTEKIARRLAFLHGTGNNVPEFNYDADHDNYSNETEELPEVYDCANNPTLSFARADGIPPILLTLASGIGVTRECKVVHNPQPCINRDFTETRLATMNKEEDGIIDSYLSKNQNGVEQVGFAFIAFVMEQPPEQSTAHADLPGCLAKARQITTEDVKRLELVLKVKLTHSDDMKTEQRLHLVFQAITKKFGGFKSLTDLKRLLHLLLRSAVVTSKHGPVDAAALHCWDDIREVVYLTKLAWVALKLPCLGAIAGKARMYAATHALLGIKATPPGDGPPYAHAHLMLREPMPVSLTQSSISVEFYAIRQDLSLPVSVFALFSESVAKQNSVAVSAQFDAQGLLPILARQTAIQPTVPWNHSSFIAAISAQVAGLARHLDQLNCVFLQNLQSFERNKRSMADMIKKACKDCGRNYALGARGGLDFSKPLQPPDVTGQGFLFFPLIGLLKIQMKSDEIPSPHQALVRLILRNDPVLPIFPTAGSFDTLQDRAILKNQLHWMKIYMRDLLYPIVGFMTQWLCDLQEKSPSQLGKDMVCQWVWAFVWELLDHYGGPYIDICWMQSDQLHLVRELLDSKEDERKRSCLAALNMTQLEENKKKVFSSNLFGVVVYLICHMELKHFTLTRSFDPSNKSIELSTAPGSTLDEAIFTATCPQFLHQEKLFSLFQMTRCLLEETDDAQTMAKKVNDRLMLWGPSPSEVLSRLFDAADPKSGKVDTSGNVSGMVDITAAKLRLVFGWWVPPELEKHNIADYNDRTKLEGLLDIHIATALGKALSKQQQRHQLAKSKCALKAFTSALEFIEVDDSSKRPLPKDKTKSSGKKKGKRPKAGNTSNKSPIEKQPKTTEKDTEEKAKAKDDDNSSKLPTPTNKSNVELESSTRKRPKVGEYTDPVTEEEEADEEPRKKKAKPSSKDKEMEDPPVDDAPVDENSEHTSSKDNGEEAGKEDDNNEQRASSKEKDMENPPVNDAPEDENSEHTSPEDEEMEKAPEAQGTDQDVGALFGIAAKQIEEKDEDKWKRLGVDKWSPKSKVIPDSRLKKEILLMPCLDNSAHTAEAAVTVQFRKLTVGKIQCYICDFVPKDHLQKMVLFHRSTAFCERYEEHSLNIDPYNVDATKEEDEASKSFKKLDKSEQRKQCKGRYNTYYSRYKDDNSYWYEESFEGAQAEMQVVDDFMKAIATGVKAVRKEELNIDIEFQEMHGVAITTTQDAFHQRAHVDHGDAFDMGDKDAPQNRAYIGHMPLQSEGMVLRLENLTEKMLHYIKEPEQVLLDNKSEVVQDHLYLHIPFGSILLIDDRTFHGGHYGTAAKHRFHFVLSPYDWTPWKKSNNNISTNPRPMRNAEKKADNLMFLIQAARFYAGHNPKVTAFWNGDNDPIVAMPRLKPAVHLDLSTISDQKEYWDKRGSFYKAFAAELVQNGGLNKKLIRCIIDE